MQDSEDAGKALSECAYAAHFRFAPSIMPGYFGDLFLVVGDAIDEPFSVIRGNDGRLSLA